MKNVAAEHSTKPLFLFRHNIALIALTLLSVMGFPHASAAQTPEMQSDISAQPQVGDPAANAGEGNLADDIAPPLESTDVESAEILPPGAAEATPPSVQRTQPPPMPPEGAPFSAPVTPPRRKPLPSPSAPTNSVGTAQNTGEGLRLDFNNVDITVVIDTISKYTGKNFIYDEKVRGSVTIVSPTPISVDQAYAVLESMLQVKGFATVEGPGGVIKVIPATDAKQSSIDTSMSKGGAATRDRFVTRLIPLHYVEAGQLVATLSPLVSRDASLMAYEPTNTVIITDVEANIKRVLSILETIDVETYRAQLALIKIEHADATVIAGQLVEIFGGEVRSATDASPTATARRVRTTPTTPAGPNVSTNPSDQSQVRIITDMRTNSLIVLASRSKIEDIRALVTKLDVPVTGGGRIHVYYLKHADAEKLTETLTALISSTPTKGSSSTAASSAAANAAATNVTALRSAVVELEEGVSVTADPATNSLVIRASQEGFNTLSQVISKLDIYRPQVLVEALFLEVDMTNSKELGFNGFATFMRGKTTSGAASATADDALSGIPVSSMLGSSGTLPVYILNAIRDSREVVGVDADGKPVFKGSVVQGIIRASATVSGTNIVSSPSILTSDNEEAEVKIGNNIPLVSKNVTNLESNNNNVVSNIERQDIGIVFRVTPQISDGNQVRLEIFQEMTNVNPGLTDEVTEDKTKTGVALSKRNIKNTVVVANGDTVVIGGLISDQFDDGESKIPFLGDIPFLGWAFKTRSNKLQKTNLIVFLTPHIMRDGGDAERVSTYKREEFRNRSLNSNELARMRNDESDQRYENQYWHEGNPIVGRLKNLESRYPVANIRDIETQKQAAAEVEAKDAADTEVGDRSLFTVVVGVYPTEARAMEVLSRLVDAGFDGDLITAETDGTLLYRVHIGPYTRLSDADRAAAEIREKYGIAASVLVGRKEEP